MANYRRLISYIYAYEGGIKGKNIGYAKIELRGEICKIQVSVKKVYVGSNEIQVYLLAQEQEIPLGRIFIRNGTGEFRAQVDPGNVEKSGYPMEACHGLTIHEVGTSWQCYTTIWEDAVAQTAELQLAEVTAEKVRKKEAEKGTARKEQEKTPDPLPISREIEEQLRREEQELEAVAPWEETQPAGVGDASPASAPTGSEIHQPVPPVPAAASPKPASQEQTPSVPPSPEITQPLPAGPELIPPAPAGPEIAQPSPAEPEIAQPSPAGPEIAPPSPAGPQVTPPAPTAPEATPPMPERPEIQPPSPAGPEGTPSAPEIPGTAPVPQETPAAVAVSQPRYVSPAKSMNTAMPETGNRLLTDAFAPAAPQPPEPAPPLEPAPQPPEPAPQPPEPAPQSPEPAPQPPESAPQPPEPAPQPPEPAPQPPEPAPQLEPAPNPADLLPDPEDPRKLEELDRMERETASREDLWSRLQRLHTKVLAFDYDNGCEILSIKPQDIGLLPREIWGYGNNSFLLHGYYNYRHLILARLHNPKGAPRYLLGVPGHYFSNEKYMASMFGFPHFVLAKKQPESDGRFGYWYTDIRL